MTIVCSHGFGENGDYIYIEKNETRSSLALGKRHVHSYLQFDC